MSDTTFRITGRVIDANTQTGIQELRIEAWDKDLFFDDFVGSALSDAEGRFRIAFNERHFRELIQRRPDLYFKLFQYDQPIAAERIELEVILPDGSLLTGRGDEIFWKLAPGEVHVEIKLALPPEEMIYSVRGRVTEPDGSPITGMKVQAYDIRLRGETLLGQASSDEEGAYLIRYSAATFIALGKQSPDLDIRVFDAQGDKIAWLHNPPLLNARRIEEINLVRDGQAYLGPSDFQRRVEALLPTLSGINLATLEAEELSYLIRKTGQDADLVVGLAKASRLAALTQQPAEVFYALIRQGLPQTLTGLVRQSPELVRQALRQAAKRNLIPAGNVDQQAEALLARFKELAVELALKSPAEPERLSLGTLLATTLETEPLRQRFLTAYANHSGPIRAFWENLAADEQLGSRVGELQLTLQLGALSLNHQKMLDKLQELRASGAFGSVLELVRYGEDEWKQIITDGGIGAPPTVPGEDDAEKVGNYAKILAAMVEDAFPSAFVAHRLPTGEIKQFLYNHPDFNLRATPVGSYLHAQNDVSLGEEARALLRAMQRTYRVAPRYRAMQALLDDGLDSAYRISRLGKNVFLRRYSPLLGAKEARRAYERAHQIHALAISLLADAGLVTGTTSLQVVNDNSVSEMEGIPDWQTLFRDSLELCECEHCRSVLSPAAYLVDVLHFLRDREPTNNKSPKDILFERRPDLGCIELTCENTETPVPYIDLLNEILEDAVAPPRNFKPWNPDPAFEANLNARTISAELRTAFQVHHCSLSDCALITVGGQGQGHIPLQPWWTIDDVDFTYHIRKPGVVLTVVSRSRQTRGTTAERAAMPQYVNPDAYQRLREEVHPWTVPFDLDWETIRVYLAHLRASRAEIQETFRSAGIVDILPSQELTHEILGLNADEAAIITGGKMKDMPWKLWGFSAEEVSEAYDIPDPADSTKWITSGNWLELIAGRVDVFLQQSGLRYREMLDLLDMAFVNPRGDSGERMIHLISKDSAPPDTCETRLLALQGLEAAPDAAVRMVRFVRLWRRLGWSMRELDLARIALPLRGGPPQDPQSQEEGFLDDLSQVVRLRDRLGIPVERLLPFWLLADAAEEDDAEGERPGAFWTASFIDHGAAGQPRLPSLYEKLFRNRTVLNLSDADFPEDPANLSGAWSEYATTLGAALGVGADDLTRLLADSKVLRESNPGPSLANVTRLYRHATLAGALGLSVPDYLSILALQEGNPFASPLATRWFIDDVDLIRESGFSVRELDYLLRHTDAATEELAPREEEIAQVLEDLRAGLQAIAAENTYRQDDPTDPKNVTTDPTRNPMAISPAVNWPLLGGT